MRRTIIQEAPDVIVRDGGHPYGTRYHWDCPHCGRISVGNGLGFIKCRRVGPKPGLKSTSHGCGKLVYAMKCKDV